MAQQFETLTDPLIRFVAQQKIFFTATAAPTGRVNMSPRSTEMLRVISPSQILYLDFFGSGSETSAHLRQLPRMTIMLTAFEQPPRILRLYGTGATHPKGSADYDRLLGAHFAAQAPRNARQIVVLDIDLVQSSCGYGVPLFDYQGERDNLKIWADAKSEEELETYAERKNTHSIDGFDTGFGLKV